MTTFTVGTIKDNSKTRLIGYAVYSQSKFGGVREHFSRMGQHEESLARAKAECEVEAKRLQDEADANRARQSARRESAAPEARTV